MIFGPIYCSFCGKDSNLLPLHLSLAEWQDMLPQRPNLEVDLSVLRPEKGKDENCLIILERNRKTKNRFLSTSTGLTSKWTIVVDRKFFGTLRVLTLSQSFILSLSLSHSIWKNHTLSHFVLHFACLLYFPVIQSFTWNPFHETPFLC